MRLIDADELKKKILLYGKPYIFPLSEKIIDNAPTIEAEPIVRCKDCKWHKGNECTYEYYYDEYDSTGNLIPMYDDDFCSFGERGGGGENE